MSDRLEDLVPVGDEVRWGNEVVGLVLGVAGTGPVVLRSLLGRGMRAPETQAGPLQPGGPVVDVLLPRYGRRPGSHRMGETENGARLRFLRARAGQDGTARELRVTQRDELTGLLVTSVFRAWPGVSAFQTWTELEAAGDVVHVEAVTTFRLTAFPGQPLRGADDLDMIWARSAWASESVWTRQTLRSAGVTDIDVALNPHTPRNRFAVTSVSSWSTGEFLPTGVLTTRTDDASLAWQIEHSGAWTWEAAEDIPGVHVTACGPTEVAHQWSETLSPGERFVSVPASVAVVGGGPQDAVAELTLQRRALRPDRGEALPVIYNDYMNTLFGDPTTPKEEPLIDAAAAVGADYFCIDAGWYDDTAGSWWDSVGEWLPSTRRFPGGLERVLDRIRDRGMVPGLWLEPEVIGVHSPMAARLPDDAFFSRHGVRVRESGRYHLDLRSPAARAHLDETVDRLVGGLGVGFLKLDYNIMPGTGTDRRDADAGSGLLGHNRAYLDWLDGVQARHPRLLIENCASGAMRMDYSLLSRLHLQSTSDQCDPLRYAFIAAAAPMSVLPEQAGNWGYAQQEMSDEQAAFTLAAGILGRLYLSGFVDRMDGPRRDLVREAVAVHREVLTVMPGTVPFWPLGLPAWDDDWLALGLRPAPGARDSSGAPVPDELWVTVWRRGGAGSCVLELPAPAGSSGREIEIDQVFPARAEGWEVDASPDGDRVSIRTRIEEPSARVLRIRGRS